MESPLMKIITDISCGICHSLRPNVVLPADPVPSLDNIRWMIAELGKGKTDQEQCSLWYELERMAFNELGEVYIDTWEINTTILKGTMIGQYPGLVDIKIPDGKYLITDQPGMQRILSRDWTNLVPYVLDESDCDKYGGRLYEHCCRYYKLNTVFPVWGYTSRGYHGFNCVALKDGDLYTARLIEPQTDQIFLSEGLLGTYKPDQLVLKLAELVRK